MNRKQREAARTRQEAQSKARSEDKKTSAQNVAREAKIVRALANERPRVRHSGLAAVVFRKAPRLFDVDDGRQVTRLLALPSVRPVDAWEPRGKGREALFRSLAAHCLAKYPTPAVMWNAFRANTDARLVALAAHVAGGGSLFDLVKSGSFPVPLTRAMCAALLATPAEHDLLDAIRRVQARAAGCDPRFYQAWIATRHARALAAPNDEEFAASVLTWFGTVGMIEPGDVGPLYDYLEHRRREDPTFRMKGRSGPALLRAVREWHGQLAKEKAISGVIFGRSGFNRFDQPFTRREARGVTVKERWRIDEIVTARTLAEEGKRMGHCVYSYAWRIERGDISIWSVTMEDGLGETGRWHMVTLEVRNDLRRIVQARGRFNRSMTPREHAIVAQWAGMNNLQIALGVW